MNELKDWHNGKLAWGTKQACKVNLTFICTNENCPTYRPELDQGRQWEVSAIRELGYTTLVKDDSDICFDCGEIGTLN